jgi:FtsP/CotA-like multicopper oxidase with cupredoxin domain
MALELHRRRHAMSQPAVSKCSPRPRALVRELFQGGALVLLLNGCGARADDVTVDDDPRVAPGGLTYAADRDPDPAVVSVRLVAEERRLRVVADTLTALKTFSGSLPGPVIRATRGARVVVELTNRLPQPTTLHFHGVRLENGMDGVPDVTQPAVPPGGVFTYDFQAVDAGLYWYHPHHDSLGALGAGLFGALLVDDPDDEPELGDEVLLVLSDLTLDASGAIITPEPDAEDVLLGREGNVVLVNGKQRPTFEATPGRRQRWRILNSARSRYFRLGLPGHTFLQIGSDGGRLERPVTQAEPVITPGERLDLLVEPQGELGATLELLALPLTRALGREPSPAVPLLELSLVPSSAPPSPPLPALTRSLAPIDTRDAETVPLALTVDDTEGDVTMGVNGIPFAHHAPVHARVGTTQILAIQNHTPFDHPFHLHGFSFQELDANGASLRPLQSKDTLNVPALTTRRVAVAYDDRPGMWMFHCHILDHAQVGMMGMIHLSP